MVKVNFRTSDFKRQVADENSLTLKNRYFEQNPFLSDDGSALIARPGLKKLTVVGDGPIRGLNSEAGSFGGDMFIASGASFYRLSNLLAQTKLYTGLNNPETGFVKIAITGDIGDTPAFCFVADGANLWVYTEKGFATNTLTGTPSVNDVIDVGGVYYQWTDASVDANSPDGTNEHPWLVNIGLTPINSFTNMASAINANGDAGTDYSTNLAKNEDVEATQFTSTLMSVRALVAGIDGNQVVTTDPRGPSLGWTQGNTLSGGGLPTFTQVTVPDDMGAIDVGVINSYVIVIPQQTDGYQGRFFWILPGETTIDPLNFATAERSPDGVYGVQVFGDQFWLPGESTTEVWYVAGPNPSDPTASPMQRLQGVVFDRGSWKNTPKAVHEQMVIVDADGGVFLIQGTNPKRVSTPDIEEEIRVAMGLQQTLLIQ